MSQLTSWQWQAGHVPILASDRVFSVCIRSLQPGWVPSLQGNGLVSLRSVILIFQCLTFVFSFQNFLMAGRRLRTLITAPTTSSKYWAGLKGSRHLTRSS